MLFTKPEIIKYECKNEGFIIYFTNQYEAAKYFNITVQKFNFYLNYKKGVISFEEVPDRKLPEFIDNTLYRVWKLPVGKVVDIEYEIDDDTKYTGVYESGKYLKKQLKDY